MFDKSKALARQKAINRAWIVLVNNALQKIKERSDLDSETENQLEQCVEVFSKYHTSNILFGVGGLSSDYEQSVLQIVQVLIGEGFDEKLVRMLFPDDREIIKRRKYNLDQNLKIAGV